jgi:hypothetical protein
LKAKFVEVLVNPNVAELVQNLDFEKEGTITIKEEIDRREKTERKCSKQMEDAGAGEKVGNKGGEERE